MRGPCKVSVVVYEVYGRKKYRQECFALLFHFICLMSLAIVLQTSFAVTFSDHNPDMFSPSTKYHLLCLQADAYFNCSQYKQAEVEFSLHRLVVIIHKKLSDRRGTVRLAMIVNLCYVSCGMDC